MVHGLSCPAAQGKKEMFLRSTCAGPRCSQRTKAPGFPLGGERERESLRLDSV